MLNSSNRESKIMAMGREMVQEKKKSSCGSTYATHYACVGFFFFLYLFLLLLFFLFSFFLLT